MKICTTRDVLIETKRVLQTHDWLQGRATNANHTAFCLLGAIEHVGAALYLRECATNIIRRMLPNSGIAQWNDTYGRTKEEVIDLLNQAIERT